jgi:hypothetical protein
MRSLVADGGRSLSRMSEWATRALCCAYQPYASMPLRAGYRDVEVLAIEHDFWRLYRLVP